MKKSLRSDKLALRKETVRTLNEVQLEAAVGGDVTSTVRSLALTCRVCLTSATTTNP